MANIIKIKRGSGVPASGVLAGHELGWDYTNDSLYIGVEGASPIKIADAFAGYLSINKATGKLYATGAFEVDGATQLDGAVTVNNTLSVTGSNTLTVGGLSYLNGGINVNTGKFTVASSTGNTYVSGTLTVDGSTTLGDSNDDVNTIRGIVTISDIDRLTTINGSLEVNQAVGIDGNLRVGISDTTKFSVNSTSGNIGTVGDLTVDGSTNLNGILDVDGGTTLRSTLGVLGNTTLTGTLTANNDVFANANVTIGNASTDILTVNSTSTFNAPLTVSTGQLTSLDGGLDVNAKLTISATTGDIVTAGDITAVNAVINGDLTVHGTTTTVNSTTVEIADPIFTLGQTLATSDAKDRGIEFNYGTTASPLTGFFGLDESTGRFTFIPDALNTSEVFSGVYGDFQLGEIYQPQTDGIYDPNGSLVNASAKWNDVYNAMQGSLTGTQYDLLQADANGVFQPTKTISAASGITIDCGEY